MARTSHQPDCKTGVAFVRERLGNTALGPLTGQDHRAFAAFLHLLQLYAVADNDGMFAALQAMRATLQAMQRSCWPIAKAAIPHALDWSNEEPMWATLMEGMR